jgi:indolepyruvate ferredoxin oxidoreductase
MIRNIHTVMQPDEMVQVILKRTRASRNILVTARVAAERLFGDYMMANMVAVGTAYQAGLLPISGASIERAIMLNGAAAKANIMAFRAGRLGQHAPKRFAEMLATDYSTLADRIEGLVRRSTPTDSARIDAVMRLLPNLPPEAERLARIRVADLIAYQNEPYAARFAVAVDAFAAAEMRALPKQAGKLTLLVIRGLHKLMANKDEYEVARLLTDPVFEERVKAMFPDFKSLAFNLQPPFVRAIGLTRKVEFGEWFKVPLRILAWTKMLRGTMFDPFGRNAVRQEERALVDWYLDLVDFCIKNLSSVHLQTIEAILALPDSIRGYEHIKMENAAAARTRARNFTAELSKISTLSLPTRRQTQPERDGLRVIHTH